jgi:exopolysaccharide production protein ExoQ
MSRSTWIIFLFLAGVFFSVCHDLSYSKRGIDNYNLSQEDIISDVSQGSLARQIALLAAGLFAIVSLVSDRASGRLRIDGPLGWILLSFAVWAFLSPIWAEDEVLTIKRLAVFGILCIAAVAVARRFSLREIILLTFFTTALFLAIGIFAELIFGAFRPFASGYRFAGTQHPNGQGIDCALLLLSAVAAADLDKRRRLLFWAFGLLGFLFMILTHSRTAFAAALVALALYFTAICSKRTKILVAFGLSIALWILVVVGGGALFSGLKNVAMLGRVDATTDSLNGRAEIWQGVSYYVHRRPILGYGYGGFWNEDHVAEMSSANEWGVGAGHSAYVDCLLELGVVGLVAYVLALLLGIGSAFHLHRVSKNTAFAFWGALLVFCALDGLLESVVVTPTLPMFLFLVAIIRLAYSRFYTRPNVSSLKTA